MDRRKLFNGADVIVQQAGKWSNKQRARVTHVDYSGNSGLVKHTVLIEGATSEIEVTSRQITMFYKDAEEGLAEAEFTALQTRLANEVKQQVLTPSVDSSAISPDDATGPQPLSPHGEPGGHGEHGAAVEWAPGCRS